MLEFFNLLGEAARSQLKLNCARGSEMVISFAMPFVWVMALLAITGTFFVFLRGGILRLGRATGKHEQQPAEVEDVAQVTKRKGKKQRYRERNREKSKEIGEEVLPRLGESQNHTSKMEEQGDEMLQQTKDDDMLRETVTAPTHQCECRDENFNHQLRTKDVEFQHVEVKWKHLEESPAQNKTKDEEKIANLEEKIANLEEKNAYLEEKTANLEEKTANLEEENANLKEKNANFIEEIAELKQDRKAQDEPRVPKLEQVSRAEEASSEKVQPGGEDQTGVSAIHASKPVATEREQPRFQFGTVGMEKEVPSCESEAEANDMLVAARTKLINSEDKNKSVEEGLKKPCQPFSRKNSFSSEASLRLDVLSGDVAEGRQPLSAAKDAVITTQIDKEIIKEAKSLLCFPESTYLV